MTRLIRAIRKRPHDNQATAVQRLTKQLLRISAAILLVTGLLGVYGFVRSTNAAPLRAESFKLWRIRVAQVNDQDQIRFFCSLTRGRWPVIAMKLSEAGGPPVRGDGYGGLCH